MAKRNRVDDLYGAEAQAEGVDRAIREAKERFEAASRSRGDELPNALDLTELWSAYRQHGELSAAGIIESLGLLLHGPQFAHKRNVLLERLAAAARRIIDDASPVRHIPDDLAERLARGEEVQLSAREIEKIPIVRRRKGRPMTVADAMFVALCRAGEPRIETHGFDAVVRRALMSVRSVIGGTATVTDVRKLLDKRKPDHESVIRACFRASGYSRPNNLGKSKIVQAARAQRQK